MSVSDVKKVNKLNELKIGFIADDIRDFTEFDIFHNTTFGLMLAAQEFDTKLLLAESNNLKTINGKVFAKFDEVIVKREVGNPLKVKGTDEYSLDSFNIIRISPLFNHYIFLFIITFIHFK